VFDASCYNSITTTPRSPRSKKKEVKQTAEKKTVITRLQLVLRLLPRRLGFRLLILPAVPPAQVLRHAGLDHARDDLEGDLRGGKGGGLAGVVVAGADLDDVGADDVELLDAAQDADELARRPAAGLGGAGAGRGARVQHVDVDGEVDGLVRVEADAVDEAADDADGPAQLVDVVRVDAQEALLGARVGVVAVVDARQARAEAAVGRGRVGDEPLGAGDVEEAAVVEARLLREPVRGVAHGVPRVEVRVEVQHRDGLPVDLVQRAQGGQGDAVVAAEGDQPGPAGGDALGAVRGVGGGGGGAGQQLQEGLVHLALGEAVVEGGDGDVAAVEQRGPRPVRVDAGAHVVAGAGQLAGAGGADGAGAEAGACVVSMTLSSRTSRVFTYPDGS